MFYIIVDLLIGCLVIHKIVKEANTKLPSKKPSEKWYFAVRYIYLVIFLAFAISRFLRHVLVAIQNQLLIASWIMLAIGVVLLIARTFIPHKTSNTIKITMPDDKLDDKLKKDLDKINQISHHQEADLNIDNQGHNNTNPKANEKMHHDNMQLNNMVSKLEDLNYYYMTLFMGKPLSKVALLDVKTNPKLKKAINVLGSHYDFDINDYIKAEESAIDGKPDKLNDIKNSIQANPLTKNEQSADIKKVTDYMKQLENSANSENSDKDNN